MQNNLINGNKYRRDIDGLRAIAVISVVGFHFFPNWIFGGYIGVDIFFVISGYLITSIIYNQLLEKKFSIINFYIKRIKRIFPALITVLIATIIFGYFTLTNEEYKLLGRHVKESATFLSNFYYWREAGYFDNRAESKPLLHLWSLAIEEQFYII
jgi:peptidoglycan/LPS O-acetylase OafA/YrhL